MAVYFKFKSAKDYDSIPILGQSISVVSLKDKIFQSKHLGSGRDFDLVVSNAQTNEEYLDESAMIPRNSSVLIRRIAGWPCRPIVVEQDKPKVEDKVEDLTPPISSMTMGSPSTMGYTAESVWDDFGDDPYAVPEVAVPAQLSNSVVDTSLACKADEDIKIKALVENSALDGNRQIAYGAGRGFGMRGRIMAGRSFGLECQTPPAGYICHRCKVQGHFIQHCPTNGDPSYDIQRMKPSNSTQNSIPLASAASSCAPSSGIVAILKLNEAASEKDIKGLPSTYHVSDIPPELRCPLCKELMNDAVLTRKCCFRSYCDKCIRDYIITNSKCMCGVINVLADDLVPNIALREIISHTLKSTSSSTENLGSLTEVRDVDYVHNVQHKITVSKDSKQSLSKQMETPGRSEGEVENVELPPLIGAKEEISMENIPVPEMDRKKLTVGDQGFVAPDTSEGKVENVEAHSTENKITRKTDPFETLPLSVGAKEAILMENLPIHEMDQKKLTGGEQGFIEKKKKNKKRPLLRTVADMSWRAYQNFGAENFYGIPPFNQYWAGGVPIGGHGYMAPFNGAMPYMCLTTGPFDVPSGRIPPQEPFPAQGSMMPGFPQRDIGEEEMTKGAHIMSREEFDIKKASLRRMRKTQAVNRPDKEEKSRNAEKCTPDLRRPSSPMPTKHRESSSEKRKLDLSCHSRPVKQRTSSPENHKPDSICYSSPRPAKERASNPGTMKLDSSRHSLPSHSSPRPAKERASNPGTMKLDSSRHSLPRPDRRPEKHKTDRRPEKHKTDRRRHSSPRPAKQRAYHPERRKLDSSGHSLPRPDKQNASSPPDWRRHSSPRSAKQRASSHDRNQKHNVFSHVSLDENGGKKRKAMNESKDNKVEQRPVGNGYWDERKTEKRPEGGVAGRWWGGRYEDESSEEECHFKRRRRSPS